MIIQILSNLFEEGYLARDKYSSLSAFFAGANVAFRRQAIEQAGPYDTNCFSGEDQDMCLRVAQAGWELYFEPKAIVRHKNKMTLRAFARKWYDYGFYHPYIYKKHNPKSLEIYRINKKKIGETIYDRLLSVIFPFNVHVFLTPFLMMHLFLILAIVLAITGYLIPSLVALLITLAIAISYFRKDMSNKNILQSVKFVFLRYTANLGLMLGGFLGGIKLRMLYISATFDSTS